MSARFRARERVPFLLPTFTLQTPAPFSKSNLWTQALLATFHAPGRARKLDARPPGVHMSIGALQVFADMAFPSQDQELLKDKSCILFSFVLSVVFNMRMLNE